MGDTGCSFRFAWFDLLLNEKSFSPMADFNATGLTLFVNAQAPVQVRKAAVSLINELLGDS